VTDVADTFDWGLLEPAGAAGHVVSDDRILNAMVDVENAYLAAWSELLGVESAAVLETDLVDRAALLDAGRSAGVPVVGLVQALRQQGGDLVHEGMTSQDVLDTALMIASRDALTSAREALAASGHRLARLAADLRATPAMARTLTQEAEPTTLGVVISVWLDIVTSTIERLDAVRFPLQLGGAVGTGEAFVRLSGNADAADELRRKLSSTLGLTDAKRSWHTDRSPVLAVASAAAQVCVAGGRIGRDLALLAREDVATPLHGGGSSAMPHKQNPVDAVLLTANGLRSGGPLATLHAAALSYDARPAGEWHAEWQAWREILRLAAESADLLEHAIGDLVVHPVAPGAARPNVEAAARIVEAAIERFSSIAERSGS
jgi:3-carboxy-cis,cis-muconate cycloisomerase